MSRIRLLNSLGSQCLSLSHELGVWYLQLNAAGATAYSVLWGPTFTDKHTLYLFLVNVVQGLFVSPNPAILAHVSRIASILNVDM